MKVRVVAVVAILLIVIDAPAQAGALWGRWIKKPNELEQLNSELKGHILDFTFNHTRDLRFYSPALDKKRDMYIYLPPGYDPCQSYPLIILMHGFANDEHSFVNFVKDFDGPMACGAMPAAIVAAPDGSLRGRATMLNGGSFYVNSRAGRFEDYIMQDVWDFVHRRFPIRPEREAHVLMGGSMGGFGAYNLGIKYRDRIGVVAGIFPPLNLRYLDCHGRYFANFDPNCLGWRTDLRPCAPIARYACGLVSIREKRMVRPLFGRDPSAIDKIARENPVEMLDLYGVQPGELEMFVGYVGHDAFNIDAQVESFLYIARGKGLTVSSVYLPEGRHNIESAKKLMPSLIAWLAVRLEPYAPPLLWR